ncbi:MAG: NAD(P)/FAD-dependent oxidoreductase [Verrucomicrobiota bacterium]
MGAPVIIVGAGMAGLACARTLHRAGRAFQLFEADFAPGGRVRTDVTEDGFRLDRGFQVLLTAYPELRTQVQLDTLKPKAFRSGAVIRLRDGKETLLRDPLRDPLAVWAALRAPIGTLADKLRIGMLIAQILGRSPDALLNGDSMSTLEFLREKGWSEMIIDRFFVPFFGGVFLDRSLSAPAGFFKFVFQQFALGSAVLPALGMQRLPEQMAAELPSNQIHMNVAVAAVSAGGVRLQNGQFVDGSRVVLAVDGINAARLLPAYPAPVLWKKTTCIYLAAESSPAKGDGYLRLNASPGSLVHNVCFPSDVAPDYAPKGRTLVSVSSHGENGLEESLLLERVKKELADWFGETALEWKHLRTYTLPHALPVGLPRQKAADLHDGVYVCGDHTAYPSLNAALATGRRTAETILSEK